MNKTFCDVCGSDYDEIVLDVDMSKQRRSDMKAFGALGYEDVCRNCRLKLKKIIQKALRGLKGEPEKPKPKEPALPTNELIDHIQKAFKIARDKMYNDGIKVGSSELENLSKVETRIIQAIIYG